ncbi:MAG TPA: hypothetical protein VM265_09740 [Sphingomicrobium sp.]|nr:hypothetical protein [Sphingomicrobium sp.]
MGAERIALLCHVQGPAGTQMAELSRQICAEARGTIVGWTDLPVEVLGWGDPALIAPQTVALLVHGAAGEPPAGEGLLAVTIGIRRGGQATRLFGTRPRIAPITRTRDVIEASLAELFARSPAVEGRVD